VLREALALAPENATAQHALGLNLVRQRRLSEAMPLLARAVELAPENARFAYVYAVALNTMGRGDEALRVLVASQQRHPVDRDTLLALTTISRDRCDLATARIWAEKLTAVDPSVGPAFEALRPGVGR
jgi:Flp pilus assembly protein TadD